jgi:hypothetical protein
MVAIAVGRVAGHVHLLPSPTGLVHALFATQHCVLGYYQAVPAGLDKYDSHRPEKSLDSIAYTCLVYACSEHAYDQILCPRSVSWRT